MENVMIFESDKFGQIRTAGTSEEPLFCLSDVCKALELQVTPTKNRLKTPGVTSIKVGVQNTKQRLKEDGVYSINLTDSLGREQQALWNTDLDNSKGKGNIPTSYSKTAGLRYIIKNKGEDHKSSPLFNIIKPFSH